MGRRVRAAAIQLQCKLGDLSYNLSECERLAAEAGRAGARWIVLPEFFPTGMGFSPALTGKALPPDGDATALLVSVAKRFNAYVGGSFLCRDTDGETRNAFILVSPKGPVGRHDKDIPTLWENCWYIGGKDDGRFRADDLDVGVALCAELGRTATVRRLRGAELIVGGSFTWHPPEYLPRWLGRDSFDEKFFRGISAWAQPFARLVGAPVIEAGHCGTLVCRDQLLPLTYKCPIGDGAKICAADGTLLASRRPEEGPGVIVAEVEVGHTAPSEVLPAGEWIRPLAGLGKVMWNIQQAHGRKWYRSHHLGNQDRRPAGIS
jgi:hypothetical protein